jgi:hypothetical protein
VAAEEDVEKGKRKWRRHCQGPGRYLRAPLAGFCGLAIDTSYISKRPTPYSTHKWFISPDSPLCQAVRTPSSFSAKSLLLRCNILSPFASKNSVPPSILSHVWLKENDCKRMNALLVQRYSALTPILKNRQPGLCSSQTCVSHVP